MLARHPHPPDWLLGEQEPARPPGTSVAPMQHPTQHPTSSADGEPRVSAKHGAAAEGLLPDGGLRDGLSGRAGGRDMRPAANSLPAGQPSACPSGGCGAGQGGDVEAGGADALAQEPGAEGASNAPSRPHAGQPAVGGVGAGARLATSQQERPSMTQWLSLASRWGGGQLASRAGSGATRWYSSSARTGPGKSETEDMLAAGAAEIGDGDDDWELLYESSL